MVILSFLFFLFARALFYGKIYIIMLSVKHLKHAIVSTDVVLFVVKDHKLMVVIIDVQNPEYAGEKAFPGGLILPQETAGEAIKRVIHSKLNINPGDVYIEELKAYSDVHRDKRGRVVSLAYIGFIESEKINNLENSLYILIDSAKIGNLAYDHNQILKDASQKLRDRFFNSTIAQKLLSDSFTMTELHQLYRLVLGKKIDKRNFAKKIHSLGIIKESAEKTVGQKHRPARLLKFKNKEIKNLDTF